MSEIEKIKRYIQRTRLNENDGYYLGRAEILALMTAASKDTDCMFKTIATAFNYSKAKGYRAAKAERRAVAK